MVHRQHPEVAAVLRGKSQPGDIAPELLARVFQASEFGFQLLAIVEQHTAMRLRRQTERVRGETAVQGTFASFIAEAANQGAAAQELRDLFASTRIRPVITAHPTEAKRVTVLEKHRRIYRLLVEMEQPRWTARERAGIIDKLRDEIALLWMTGELRLEKPSVDQEVAWGLHFFHETLFDGVPDLLKKLDRALDQFYPGEHPALTPCFQFGSWIGGDRDGNPFVPNDVTRHALKQNALASLRHYEQHLSSLLQSLSIAERAMPLSPAFKEALANALAHPECTRIAQRDSGEPYRQFLFCMLRKLQLAIARIEGGHAFGAAGYANADELLADLRTLKRRSSKAALMISRKTSCVQSAGRLRSSASARSGSIAREHHASDPNVAGTLAGKCWPERRHPARPRIGGVEKMDHRRACPAVSRDARAARPAARGAGDAWHVQLASDESKETRPGSFRLFH